MIDNWVWWGLGWLCMPRMTLGIIVMRLLPESQLGLVLAIIGALMDASSSYSQTNTKVK